MMSEQSNETGGDDAASSRSAYVSMPPYPRCRSTTLEIWKHLKSLQAWAEQELATHPAKAAAYAFPVLDSLEVFGSLPVREQVLLLLCMRKIRMAWDETLRLFEANWGSAMSMRHRQDAVTAAGVRVLRPFAVALSTPATCVRNLSQLVITRRRIRAEKIRCHGPVSMIYTPRLGSLASIPRSARPSLVAALKRRLIEGTPHAPHPCTP